MIQIQNLTKRYYRLTALQRVSLTIPRGDVVGLLGPNGAGKTTLIKLIAGLLNPDEGRVLANGRQWPAIGYKPERLLFPNHLRVRKYMEMVAGLCNIPPARVGTAVERSLAQVSLLEEQHKKIGDCSKGMRQRLAMAQVLIGDPPLLLLDEPSNGLDPEGQRDILQIVRALHATGKTILISSHQLNEIMEVCTHLVILNRGQVHYENSIQSALAIRPHAIIRTDKSLEPMRDLLQSVSPHLSIEENELVLEEDALPLRRQIMAILLNANYDIVRVEQKRVTLDDIYDRVIHDSTPTHMRRTP